MSHNSVSAVASTDTMNIVESITHPLSQKMHPKSCLPKVPPRDYSENLSDHSQNSKESQDSQDSQDSGSGSDSSNERNTRHKKVSRTSEATQGNGSSKRAWSKWHATLNATNVLITPKEVQEILKKGKINIAIDDIEVWRKAFVHKSYIEVKQDDNKKSGSPRSPGGNGRTSPPRSLQNVLPLQKRSNERLEWLGDAILQAAATDYLWERFPEQDEGFLTKLRSKLVKTKNLAYLATKLGLAPYLIISYHVEFGCHGRTNQRILENTFEAFIGAMYVDFSKKKNKPYGFEACRRFVIAIIEKYVDMVEMIVKDDNFKDQLMWYYQKTFNGAYPIYQKEKYENDCFHIYVTAPNSTQVVGRGVARSKKKAEQMAAKDALQHFANQEAK